MGGKSHFVRGGVDALDPSKTAGGVGNRLKQVKRWVPRQCPFPSNLESCSASRPPEGARSLSEFKQRRRLQRTRKGCGVEGAATLESIPLGCSPTLGVDSASVWRHFAPWPSTLAAPYAVTSGRLFVRPLLAFASSTACPCSGLEGESEDRQSRESTWCGPGSASWKCTVRL